MVSECLLNRLSLKTVFIVKGTWRWAWIILEVLRHYSLVMMVSRQCGLCDKSILLDWNYHLLSVLAVHLLSRFKVLKLIWTDEINPWINFSCCSLLIRHWNALASMINLMWQGSFLIWKHLVIVLSIVALMIREDVWNAGIVTHSCSHLVWS